MKKAIIPFCILIIVSIQTIKSQNAPVTTIGNEIMTGTTVTVPITVSNFTNIGSCNLKITYDQLKVTATSVTIGSGVVGNINTNLSVPGVITLGWYTYPGINLVNNTVFLNLNFQKVSLCTSNLTFVDDGNSCLYYNGNFIALNDIPYATYYQNGSVSILATPTFTNLGPYVVGSTPGLLPQSSLNGITGTWAPATISTLVAGTFIYTFTPNPGQCATTTTMSIQVNPLGWQTSQDIGTTLFLSWGPVTGAASYAIFYRPLLSPPSGAWIGNTVTYPYIKAINLTPGATYECYFIAYTSSGSPIAGGTASGTFTPSHVNFAKSLDMGTTCQIDWDDWSSWVSSYVFQYQIGSTWIPGVRYANNGKASNLTPGVTYQCRVVVYRNGNLWGTTESCNFTPQPIVFTLGTHTSTSCNISWTSMDPWATGFHFYYKKTTDLNWIGIPAYQYNHVYLTGITPGVEYQCKVWAFIPTFWGETAIGTFTLNGAKEDDSHFKENEITIYPNPFEDQVNMDIFTEKETIVIWNFYDMTGKEVLSGNRSISAGYNTFSIDATQLSKGVYMLNAMMDVQMKSFRIIKK